MAERLISLELCGIANYSVVRHLAQPWLRRRFLVLPKLSCQPQATVTHSQMIMLLCGCRLDRWKQFRMLAAGWPLKVGVLP